ncbi:MAG: hypothetical protein MUC44_01990 [Beijerinckiaceae bacterium]|jgi:hypothetical protein|nr:hypothetical protein [Beijerinckiaceae bacterium]
MDQRLRTALAMPVAKSLALIVVTAGLVAAEPVRAQSVCPSLDGEWTGTISGRLVGKLTMSINNCAARWVLPDGRINYCNYSGNRPTLEYACSLGSRGTVAVQGRKLTIRNTYTGDNYVISVTKR